MDSVDPLNLLKFRQSTGMTQKQFAESAGVNLRTYRSYEKGERALSYAKFVAMKEALGYQYSATGQNLRAMIDYLRVTFKQVKDLATFCLSYLGCALEDFTDNPTGLLAYNRVWKRGNIWLFDYADKINRGNYQVTLQLSGQGCREMELLLDTQGVTWYDFLAKLAERSDMQVTRLDIALDELFKGDDKVSEHIYLSDLIGKVYLQELQTKHIKTWSHVGGGNLKFKGDDDDVSEAGQGITIYFGSRQSELYFCFYEKRYEMAKRENVAVEEALEVFGIWNRYELRLSQGKADSFVKVFLEGQDLGEMARGLLVNEFEVFDGVNKYGAYQPDPKWQSLFGGVEPLQLTVRPEPYNIERTVRWLIKQVADSYTMVAEADKILKTNYLDLFQTSGKINDRGAQVLKYLKTDHNLMTNEPEKGELAMITLEQYLFDHYGHLDKLIDQVVELLPDKVFYKAKLKDRRVQKMQQEIHVLNVKHHKEPRNMAVQDEYFAKLKIYHQWLSDMAKEARTAYRKQLLACKTNQKVKVLMDLIKTYDLLPRLQDMEVN